MHFRGWDIGIRVDMGTVVTVVLMIRGGTYML